MSSVNKVSRLQNLINEINASNSVGVRVPKLEPETQLRRLVLASMLWEKQFYLDGVSHADLVKALVAKLDPQVVGNLALEARGKFKLRHIPLLLTRELARVGNLKAEVLDKVIQRADEMSEFLALYWKEGRVPVSNQVKKGLAKAFSKFNEYELAKWDKNSAAVSLRDVLFLSHAKPKSPEQAALFQRVANNQLATPLTWETELSAGKDKALTFMHLMAHNKLGALAFLRNLRNMVQSGVDEQTIRNYAEVVNVDKVLPFRYIAAARIVPQLEDMLEAMMLRSLKTLDKLPGKTTLLVDVSGSMFGTKISAKSDLDRFDAAAALAVLCKEVCEKVEIYTFSDNAVRVAPRSGFALRDALDRSQPHCGTRLARALDQVGSDQDRIIVFTDEQSYDRPNAPKTRGYIVNVAGYENGVNHGEWTTVTGFSESVIDYIRELERQ